MEKLKYINRLLADPSLTTKIRLYFSHTTAGDYYDDYEKNYETTNLTPQTIRGYVTQISPEALIWKEYGLHNIGAKEVICKAKYKGWFEKANKIEIDGEEYQVFKDGTGTNVIIQDRPYQLLRVALKRKE